MDGRIPDHCSYINIVLHHLLSLIVFTHLHISAINAVLILKVVKYSAALLFGICHVVTLNLMSLMCPINLIASAKMPQKYNKRYC